MHKILRRLVTIGGLAALTGASLVGAGTTASGAAVTSVAAVPLLPGLGNEQFVSDVSDTDPALLLVTVPSRATTGIGGAYATTFSGLFAKIASQEKVALVPFFLKGIAEGDNPAANFQADRIHPNESSQARMLANVWPELKKILP